MSSYIVCQVFNPFNIQFLQLHQKLFAHANGVNISLESFSLLIHEMRITAQRLASVHWCTCIRVTQPAQTQRYCKAKKQTNKNYEEPTGPNYEILAARKIRFSSRPTAKVSCLQHPGNRTACYTPYQCSMLKSKLNCFQMKIQQTVQYETYLIILQKIFTFPHFLQQSQRH